jgi:hypothetical protein
LKAPVNAAAIAVGDMGASGKGGVLVAEHGGEEAVKEAGAVMGYGI